MMPQYLYYFKIANLFLQLYLKHDEDALPEPNVHHYHQSHLKM